MRTTITISDELLAAAKGLARQRGVTLGEVIDAALRRELSVPRQRRERVAVPVHRGGTGVLPGVDLTSNRAMAETLDEGIDLDRLR